MKLITLRNLLITLILTSSVISCIIPDLGMTDIASATIFKGIHILGALLIGGILYLGYFVRGKYDNYHKTKQEKR